MMSVAGAADLPMKAKAPAVQYVKICSLYGAGFYYIPGTDTCLKIGGYIRTQVDLNGGGGNIHGGNLSLQGLGTRTQTNQFGARVRAEVTIDARTQGEYGTLRSYYRVGWEGTQPGGTLAGTTAPSAYWDRAFIQFAGFTVGKAQSFFDVYHHGGSRNYINTRTSGDNGAAGLMMWAYTGQFGNGFSATLSLEDPTGHNMVGTTNLALSGAYAVAGLAGNGLTNQAAGIFGFHVPDIVGNLRVDQSWGFFGVSAALHEVAGAYYSCAAGLVPPYSVLCGHPGETWGYALGVGGQLNVPGMPGDTVGAMFRWGHGTTGYIVGPGANAFRYVSGSSVAFAAMFDAYYSNPGTRVAGYGGQLELTEAWSINAHYEHVWTPALKTSIYGGYAELMFPGGAKALVCSGACGGLNPDANFWQVGSRTQWAPWKGQLNVGVDVVYTKWNSSRPVLTGATVGLPAAQTPKFIADLDNVLVAFRVQRNWYP